MCQYKKKEGEIVTPFALQEDLAHELRELFSEFRVKTKQGLKQIHVFVQDVPFTQDKKEMNELFPYIIVRLEGGHISSDKNTCRVVLILGVYDEDTNRQGYKDLMNISQKIIHRYTRDNTIAQRYSITEGIDWEAQDVEDIFPYFLSVISFEAELPVSFLFDTNI